MTTVWEAIGRALSPVEEQPRVAADLESATYKTRSGAEYVVVHNPASWTYARLDPREFELLALMDGSRSVKELVIAYYQRHGVLALARVAGLVRLLRQQRFLAEGTLDAYAGLAAALRTASRGVGAAARRATGGVGRAATDARARRSRTGEPGEKPGGIRQGRSGEPGEQTERSEPAVDCVLGAWYRAWGRFFFRRAWLWVGLALGLAGPILVVFELERGRYALYTVGGSAALAIVLLVVLALVALAVHELGHGLAVKHAGRRVREAGVRLYFGLPAAFVDTTDVWMAPPEQRLLTAFAGPWTGLVLGGTCAVAATLAPTSGLGALLFTAAFVFLVDNLFNFNPLLELDGYYMLIDFLDRPLLRPRAMAFVRGPFWSRLWQRNGLSGDERLLGMFGIGAMIYAVLAVLLALRAWQALLVPLIVSNLVSGDLWRQLTGLVVLIVVLVPLALAGWALARRALGPLKEGLAWASGRATRHRHREALASLRAVPLWTELPAGRLLEVARAMRAEDVTRGAEVIRQGEPGDRFYLIARGAFEVLVDGQPQVRLGRGDFFGERALLHRVPRAATVIAIEDGRVFMLDRADFDALLASDLSVRERIEAALAYRDELAAMPLFHDMAPGELDVLLSRLVPVSVGAGEVVIRQGDPGDRFYVVRSGEVEVLRDGEILARLGAGDAFGEIALLLDVPRTATVTSVTETSLLALEAADFRDVLAGYLGRAVELERLSHLRLLSHKRLDEVV